MGQSESSLTAANLTQAPTLRWAARNLVICCLVFLHWLWLRQVFGQQAQGTDEFHFLRDILFSWIISHKHPPSEVRSKKSSHLFLCCFWHCLWELFGNQPKRMTKKHFAHLSYVRVVNVFCSFFVLSIAFHFDEIFLNCRPAEWDPNMYQSLRSYVGEFWFDAISGSKYVPNMYHFWIQICTKVCAVMSVSSNLMQFLVRLKPTFVI